MKKQFFLTIITLSLLLLVSAQPMAIRGIVRYENNTLVPDGIITGGINGVIQSYSTINHGRYTIVVEGNKQGLPITFYLNGELLHQTVTFKPLATIDVDLYTSTIEHNKNFCGDGRCSLTECSYCAPDCTYVTCSQNNICDINIGENCDNTRDCGTCAKKNNEVFVSVKIINDEEKAPVIKESNTKITPPLSITGASVGLVDTSINYGWIVLLVIFITIITYEFRIKHKQ